MYNLLINDRYYPLIIIDILIKTFNYYLLTLVLLLSFNLIVLKIVFNIKLFGTYQNNMLFLTFYIPNIMLLFGTA